MASYVYMAASNQAFREGVDLLNDTIKCALFLDTSNCADPDLDFFDDLTNEIAATGGYTAGGEELLSKTLVMDTANNRTEFDAADFEIDPSTITARYAVIYVDTAGAASTDILLCVIDFGEDKVSTGGPFTITWNAEGIFAITS